VAAYCLLHHHASGVIAEQVTHFKRERVMLFSEFMPDFQDFLDGFEVTN
jgi:hypothetical protein